MNKHYSLETSSWYILGPKLQSNRNNLNIADLDIT